MFWKVAFVFAFCQTVYCQSANDSSEDLQKKLVLPADNFSIPTTVNEVHPNEKNVSKNNIPDESNFEDDSSEGYFTSDDSYASESSVNGIKNDVDDSDYSNFKATDQISDRLPAEPIQNNNATTSEIHFHQTFPKDRNDSSQTDLTNTQSKVVISQAVKPATFHSFNPKQEIPEFLSDRADESFSKNSESQKRVGAYGRHLSPYLNAQSNQFNSDIASNLPFSHQGDSSISELAGKVDTGLRNLFYKPFAHPEVGSKLSSAGGNFPGKEAFFSDVDSRKYSRSRPEDEGSHLYDSDRQKNPEVTRKVTVVKEKTMRSISKTEEQQSVNIPEKPQERFSSGESIILNAQTPGNDFLNHPKSRSKEETIVLVEGSHIPGKNYGPEDDLFGYHYNFYDKNSKSPPSQQFKDITKSEGNSHTSHRIQHSNHGNGVSTQFFSSSPPKNIKETQSNINIPEIDYESIGKGLPMNIEFKQDHEGGLNSGLGTIHFVPENENDQTSIKCHHQNHNHPVGNEPDVKHEEIDPNQLYIDAHTGQLIKFVTEDEAQTHVPNQINDEGNQLFKDSGTWSPQNLNDNLEGSNYPNNDFNQHSAGNFNNKGKRTRSTPEVSDLSNIDLSSNSEYNKPNNKQNYHKQDISNKNIQFEVPSEEIKLKSDAELSTFLESHHFSQNGHKGNGNVNNDNLGNVLYSENQLSNNQNNKKYGQKLNIANSDFSLPNGKDSTGHNFKSFPQVSKDLLENYEQNNGKTFHSSSGILNQPDNVNLEEHNFGDKLRSGSFKGNLNKQRNLFSKSKGNSYTPSHNEDTENFKNVYFEFPTKKGNKNINMNGHSGSGFQLPKGNNKGTEFIISDDQNDFDCTKSQNNFNGHNIERPSHESYNKGLEFDIRKHPNYMVSLQNLYGFQSKGFPMGGGLAGAKRKHRNRIQTSGLSKGDNGRLPKQQFNFKTQSTPQFQRQFQNKGQDSPNNSLKGFTFQKSGNNNQQYGWHTNGKFDGLSIDSPGIAIGHYGSNDDNIIHGPMQQNVHNFQQNALNTFNQQEPAQYILVELDDNNNNNNKGHTDAEIESYYRQYENNFKGEQLDLSQANSPDEHSFNGNGNSNNHLQSQNIRYIVQGGKDVTFPLRRLASAGFHMARSVLPLMSNQKPKSIKGNINFGLQFSKRKGPPNEIH